MGRRIQITESQLRYIIENVNRVDEQIIEENLPTISFEKSFKNNMVTIDPNNSEVQNAINQLDGYIEKARSENKELKSIDISINAGASDARATNRLPEGVSKPDHDYGGIVPANKWTTVNKRVQSSAISQLPSNYNPNQGYFAIKDGNKYLAQKRAENLQKNLNTYLNKKYNGAQIKVNIVDVNQTNKKFVDATINSIVFDTPPASIKYPYIIVYDWYQIGNSDKPYVAFAGVDGYSDYIGYDGWGEDNLNPNKKKFMQLISSENDVEVAGFNYKAGGSAFPVDFALMSYGSFGGFVARDGNTFYYTDEKAWLEAAKKISKMNPGVGRTLRLGKDQNSKEKYSDIKAKGYYQPETGKGDGSGVANFSGVVEGHGGNTGFGRLFTFKPSSGQKKKFTPSKGELNYEVYYYDKLSVKRIQKSKVKQDDKPSY